MPQEFPFPPPQGQSLVVGNATPAEVLAGATFSSQAAGIGAVGTMPNRGSPTLQPGQSIPPGYYAGGQVAGALFDTATAAPSYTDAIDFLSAQAIFNASESNPLTDAQTVLHFPAEAWEVTDAAANSTTTAIDGWSITDTAAQT
jgi:hypothetical protein